MSTKRDLTRIRHNTKIVATLGPGSNNVELLEDMIRVGGLNVVRFNFSHGTAEFHQENARIVREAAKKAGREVAIMADLQGPENPCRQAGKRLCRIARRRKAAARCRP